MNSFEDNDIALIVRPNITDGEWNGTVDLNIVSMPSPNLSQEAKDDLLYMVNGLAACFQLLNIDGVFQNKVHAFMEKMAEENDKAEDLGSSDNVVHLDQWTKTKGNA
jgi:hypothetical protein